MVCQAIGLDTNSASADYLSLYGGNKEVLAKSLGRIQRTAARIIEGLTAERRSTAMVEEAVVLPCREAA